MSDKIEFKECPLCGGDGFLLQYKPNYLWWLGCKKCDVRITFVGPSEMEKAIAIWNTRTPSKLTRELAEALESLVHRCDTDYILSYGSNIDTRTAHCVLEKSKQEGVL